MGEESSWASNREWSGEVCGLNPGGGNITRGAASASIEKQQRLEVTLPRKESLDFCLCFWTLFFYRKKKGLCYGKAKSDKLSFQGGSCGKGC